MPDDRRGAAGRFPHLNLVLRSTRPARYHGFGSDDPRVAANNRNRAAHSRRLRQSLNTLLQGFHQRSAERAEAGLTPIESGVPFVVEIPEGFDLDVLVARFKLEVVAEDEVSTAEGARRYVLVASERIEDSQLLALVEAFASATWGSGSVAAVLEIIDDPGDPRRLDAILSKKLRAAWPLSADENFLLDVSFQTRGVLADLGDRPRKDRKDSPEQHERKIAVWFDENKDRIYEHWDEFTLQLEEEVRRIIAEHRGEIVRQWEDGQWTVTEAKVNFPDSISMRIRMAGHGFTDLILNHPRIFEVAEPDETEIIEVPVAGLPEGPPPFQLQPPPANAPLVCVIDSGMQEGHRLLAPAVATDLSVCLIPGRQPDDVADEVLGGGHGTRAGGAVLYPVEIPAIGSDEARCWLGNARVLNNDCKLSNSLFPPAMLERIVDHFRGCKIFVHSINTQTPAPTRHMSAWAAKMDELSYTKDALFIVSAGNLPLRQPAPGKGFLDHLSDDQTHPEYLLSPSARVASPAQSCRR